MIFRIGDDHVVLKVDAQVFGPVQVRSLCAGGGGRPGSDDRSDLAILINNPKRIGTPLQNVYVSFGVDRGSARIYQWALSGVRSIIWNARLTVAGDCGHDARFQIQQPDATIAQIGYV